MTDDQPPPAEDVPPQPAATANEPTELASRIKAIDALVARMPAPTNTRAAGVDYFISDGPFDIFTRSGSVAFETASNPLEGNWNGKTEAFPAFVDALRLRSMECGWDRYQSDEGVDDATTPFNSNVVNVGGKNRLTDYQLGTRHGPKRLETGAHDPTRDSGPNHTLPSCNTDIHTHFA